MTTINIAMNCKGTRNCAFYAIIVAVNTMKNSSHIKSQLEMGNDIELKSFNFRRTSNYSSNIPRCLVRVTYAQVNDIVFITTRQSIIPSFDVFCIHRFDIVFVFLDVVSLLLPRSFLTGQCVVSLSGAQKRERVGRTIEIVSCKKVRLFRLVLLTGTCDEITPGRARAHAHTHTHTKHATRPDRELDARRRGTESALSLIVGRGRMAGCTAPGETLVLLMNPKPAATRRTPRY